MTGSNFAFLVQAQKAEQNDTFRRAISTFHKECMNAENEMRAGRDCGNESRRAAEDIFKYAVVKKRWPEDPQRGYRELPAEKKAYASYSAMKDYLEASEFLWGSVANEVMHRLARGAGSFFKLYEAQMHEGNEDSHGEGIDMQVSLGEKSSLSYVRRLWVIAVALCVWCGYIDEVDMFHAPSEEAQEDGCPRHDFRDLSGKTPELPARQAEITATRDRSHKCVQCCRGNGRYRWYINGKYARYGYRDGTESKDYSVYYFFDLDGRRKVNAGDRLLCHYIERDQICGVWEHEITEEDLARPEPTDAAQAGPVPAAAQAAAPSAAETSAQVQETLTRVQESSARAEEVSAQAQETLTRVQESSARAEEAAAQTQETLSRMQETLARMEERARTVPDRAEPKPRRGRLPFVAACLVLVAALVALCAGLLQSRTPRVENPVAGGEVLSMPVGTAFDAVEDDALFTLRVGGQTLEQDSIYSFLAGTPIDITVNRPEQVKRLWFQYGDSDPVRITGSQLKLKEPTAGRAWKPLYIYALLKDGTVTEKIYYKICLCEDNGPADAPLLLSSNGVAVAPNGNNTYLVDPGQCLCVIQRPGYEVASFSYDFGDGVQTVPLDSFGLFYAPEKSDGGTLTLTLTACLDTGEELAPLTYTMRFPGTAAAAALPAMTATSAFGVLYPTEDTAAAETLPAGDPRINLLTSESRGVTVTVPEEAGARSVSYKIGTRQTQTVSGRVASFEIPAEYADTGLFSLYVCYVTEDGTRSPWVLYVMDMRTGPAAVTLLRGGAALPPNGIIGVDAETQPAGTAYCVDPGTVFTVRAERGAEGRSLRCKAGAHESTVLAPDAPWEIAIPDDLTNTGIFSLYLRTEDAEGAASPWQLYVVEVVE